MIEISTFLEHVKGAAPRKDGSAATGIWSEILLYCELVLCMQHGDLCTAILSWLDDFIDPFFSSEFTVILETEYPVDMVVEIQKKSRAN